MLTKSEHVNSDMGEEMLIDWLIVMDEVSGLADKSDNFTN